MREVLGSDGSGLADVVFVVVGVGDVRSESWIRVREKSMS
jgi:hypothetical protein